MDNQKKLRNVGIFAHVDAGKTTVTEHMLYESGSIRSLGSVDKGTAHTDYLDIERKRGISVRAALTSMIWKDVKINLIDNPGHVDFSSEVERSLRVLDAAVLIISSVEGIQSQTEVLWKALKSVSIPVIIFINKIDRIGSNTAKIIANIQSKFSNAAVSLQYINGEGTGQPYVHSIIDENNTDNKMKIIECLADMDDMVLEKYLCGSHIQEYELQEKLSLYSKQGRLYPIFFGSAIKGIGITELMDGIVKYLPNPFGELKLPLSAIVYKIDHDDTIGRVAHVRLFNGMIKTRDEVLNVTRSEINKVTQVRTIDAHKYYDTGIVQAGEIAGICGLSSARIGDVLGSLKGIPPLCSLSVPYLTVYVYPVKDDEFLKLTFALQELSDEDPMLDFKLLQSERELIINIMGIIHIEVLTSILKDRYKLDVTFGKTSVIYKETPSTISEGFVSYTMPKPCWAVLRFLIEPLERGSGLIYNSKVRTEDILERYQKQVEKTLPQALEQGLYGWEVTDIKITLISGEYHVMHTHSPDFAVATPMGIMDGLTNTGTTLLEPVLKFQIYAPEEVSGRVLNDIVQMRGTFDTPIITKEIFEIEGTVPAATSTDYYIRLASMTGGKGIINTTFEGYKECPIELGAKRKRRGINPMDRAKYILYARNALSGE